ncbi:MAG: excinuclease ABC subunit UvrA [Proteobacteria bacterium]|nr:excinuclease ABC subunit UvrA [Pseudomonadota bacterium]
MPESEIRIEGARAHNLADVHCRVPLRSLSVITGVSGSGKSSLAFDTLYAEGQRRYVSSLSTYARQFLERLPRPDVDRVSHLPPAIAIEQRNRVTNARSTIGTATEILDHLRLLFARQGDTRCPDCDRSAVPGTVEAVVGRIRERFAGERLSVAAPIAVRRGESPKEWRERLVREGYTRVLDAEGQVQGLTEAPIRKLSALRRDGLLLIDRLALSGEEGRGRLAEAVAAAFARGDGQLVLVTVGGERAAFQEGFACDGCGRRFATPEPALFSFNSPLGACETCQGFGRVAALDRARVIPDEKLSLAEGAIAPFQTPMGRSLQRDLLRACRKAGVDAKRPVHELPAAAQEWVFEGDDDGWYGVNGFFEWLEGRRYKVQARVLIARYRRFDPCPDCRGARLRPEALCVFVGGLHLGDVGRLTIEELGAWLAGLELSPEERARSGRLLSALCKRVATVDQVGLGYVTLDRQVRTLSGGEAQRIQLATALGGSLTAALYVLDEPSVGLHSRDVGRLLGVLETIRDQGNTVVVVEHAPEVVSAADHLIDLGPGAGRHGGRLVVEGPVAEVAKHTESLTARALRGEFAPAVRPRRRPTGRLCIAGARARNLRNLDLEIPLGQFVVVSGVSGAGKSTLVHEVVVGQLCGNPDAGDCDSVTGGERIREVVVVDQSPASRSSRSNPATVTKSFDWIRKRFADTREARRRGWKPGWFSFNVAGGRCEACEGAGEVVVDMQFLDDVRVPCDACDGIRYRREVLEVGLHGRSIAEVLALTVDEALEFFAADAKITARLEPLARVGLGYLALGQPLSTLSGGEHQRTRLALALADGAPGSLYVLDEPTTGLHAADVQVLLGCLDQLLEAGSSVLVVEHDLDVIRHADHVLDLGPEGGPGGGRLVTSGPPEAIAEAAGSHTGAALRSGATGRPRTVDLSAAPL